MRLAVFTNQYPGKVNTFFARDMRALVNAGFEIDVFPIYSLDDNLWKYVPEILGDRYLPRDRVRHIGILRSLLSVRPWPRKDLSTLLHDGYGIGVSAMKFGIGPLAKSLYVLPKAWAWARQSPAAYDHVLAYWGNYAATCAYLFHRLTDPSIPFSIYLHAGTDLYRDQVFLKEKLLYSDCIITECEFNKKYIGDLYPGDSYRIRDRISVNYMGLDFAEFPYTWDNRSSHRVLGVGRLDRRKGYDILLKAVSELLRRRVDVELELIGSGEEEASLRRLVRELGIVDHVSFRGWVTFAEVRTAMMEATVFVHPSSGLGDAKPNVIEEAMALGAPVVATDVAGIPEMLDHGRCGILVPPMDPSALADALQLMLSSEPQRRTYSIQARAFAEERFNLWENGRRLAEMIRIATRGDHRNVSVSRDRQ